MESTWPDEILPKQLSKEGSTLWNRFGLGGFRRELHALTVLSEKRSNLNDQVPTELYLVFVADACRFACR